MRSSLLLAAASLSHAANVTLSSLFLGDAVVLQAGRGGARVFGGAAPGASAASPFARAQFSVPQVHSSATLIGLLLARQAKVLKRSLYPHRSRFNLVTNHEEANESDQGNRSDKTIKPKR